VSVLNVLAIYGLYSNVGVGTSANLGATLQVQGNIYASNGITAANYFVTSANIATINVGNITGTNSLVTFQSNVLIQGGNLVATGNLTAQNVITMNLSYAVDQVKQAAWLQPNLTNAMAIQNWIGSISNTTSGSWWSQSAKPVYGNVSPVATPGYSNSGVLLPDGRVMFTPSATGNVGYWNPSTGLYSVSTTKVPGGGFAVVVPSGNVVIVGSSNISALNPLSGAFSNLVRHGNVFAGATLDPYGNVVGIPSGSGNLISFSPLTSTFSNVATRPGGPTSLNFSGGLLLPNGNVVCVPLTNANVVQFNPATGAVSNVNFALGTTAKFSGAVLTPNGNVVFVPVSSNVGIWNPSTVEFSNVQTGAGLSSFRGGVLLPNGNVVLVPQTSANVGLINGTTRAYSNVTGTSGGFSGGVLVPDGRVIFVSNTAANVGVLDTLTPAPVEFCTGPYFNKF
jgi:streptogramin lyase